MNPVPLSLRRSINKAYLKIKPYRPEIEAFKKNMIRLMDRIDTSESEEFHKNVLSEFLRDTYYSPDYYINTHGRFDLVIHNGKDTGFPVGVLFETKRPGDKTEMPARENLNTKAIHELLLYYLQERITGNNLEIKFLIATDIREWFIFNASEFEKLFAGNKNLVKQFRDFEEKRLSGTGTDFFYKNIAEPFINELDQEIYFTYVDIRDYEPFIRNEDPEDDHKLIPLFKILSPGHLLKLPFLNDSNTLDKGFYTELLHIIGLKETKEKSRKVIGRRSEGERHPGSLIENAINILHHEDCLSQLHPGEYGDSREEQLYNIALELVITWINRILFLKLLEGQLLRYNQGNREYRFLNTERIYDYDSLNKLFFQVLAVKENERGEHVREKFRNIPYLNSSLFEPDELESRTIRISNLDNEYDIPVINSTVLRDNTGKRISGSINTLQYLFAFLDAYDFSSEGTEEIQEENKTLINASVLGLIFEKINGYKDGSFFTPGFITMYMCRETIRRAVVQKFNEAKGWSCETLTDVYNKIDDEREANRIINSLRICDPAVGSGHFLVSALNEIIAIKSELGILLDRAGKRLKHYHVEVANDELVVTDEDGELFEYRLVNMESQRVQEALFREKQALIENCLFGVDINPNSVKICRLRLWIELLKNAYYTSAGDRGGAGGSKTAGQGRRELETLPNIDINIKCGNSLISRYSLDADLKTALRNSRWSVENYRLAVMTYRNAQNKEQKREMEKMIAQIKGDFESGVAANDKRLLKLNKLKGELTTLTTQTSLFEMTKTEKLRWEKDVKKRTEEMMKLEAELEELRTNRIYENAFEWRFEFPEVLNDEGDFVGFDVVIGNPPYIYARENFNEPIKKYFYNNYLAIDNQINSYVLFLEKSICILNSYGNYSLIIPNSLLMVASTSKIRKYLIQKSQLYEIVNFIGETFESVNIETIILTGAKGNFDGDKIKISICKNSTIQYSHFKSKKIITNSDYRLNVFSDDINDNLLKKILSNSEILDKVVKIKAGLKAYQSGKGNPKQTKEDVRNRPFDFNYKFSDSTYKYLEGKDINRFCINWSGGYLRYGEHLAEPRFFKGEKILLREITAKYPKSLLATYSDEDYLFNMSIIAILPRIPEINLKYILALISSTLLSYFFIKNTAKSVRKMFPKIILNDLRKFPIKLIDLSEQKDFAIIVDKIIKMKKTNPIVDSTSLEAKIDRMVYELYGLTDDEIRIVEEAVR